MKPNAPPISTWLTADETQSQLPNAVWELLRYEGSLTQQLRKITDNKIEHRLLMANWGHASLDEQQALQLKPNDRTWIRHIEWHYHGALWVYARAVFPQATIEQTQQTITGLGVQSLGDIIFKDPNLKRGPFTFGYDPHHAWARRSILHFQHLPILITEVFLPESYRAVTTPPGERC